MGLCLLNLFLFLNHNFSFYAFSFDKLSCAHFTLLFLLLSLNFFFFVYSFLFSHALPFLFLPCSLSSLTCTLFPLLPMLFFFLQSSPISFMFSHLFLPCSSSSLSHLFLPMLSFFFLPWFPFSFSPAPFSHAVLSFSHVLPAISLALSLSPFPSLFPILSHYSFPYSSAFCSYIFSCFCILTPFYILSHDHSLLCMLLFNYFLFLSFLLHLLVFIFSFHVLYIT